MAKGELTPQNFTMYRGKDRHLRVTVRDSAGKLKDLSGAQAIYWTLARNESGSKLIQKSMAGGITIVDPPSAGQFVVALVPSDTTPLEGGDYYHEAGITDNLGASDVVVIGTPTLRIPLDA